METLSVSGIARRTGQTAGANCALPAATRLADVVRRDEHARSISVDAASGLETSAQRSRRVEPLWRKSVSRQAAALYSRRALPLRIRPARKFRRQLVATRGTGPLAAAVVRRRPAPPQFAETGWLARGRA